jgi:thymidine phosphorylase
VIECIEVLKGRGPQDLISVSVELAARMLVLGKVADDRTGAERQVRDAIASGAALERFRQIIEIQGGDPRVVDDYQRLPHVSDVHVVAAGRDGYVTRLDAELVGRASVGLGAGRDRVDDPVDPAVGIMVIARPGDEVRAGDPVLEMHYRDRARLETAVRLASEAVTIGDQRPAAGRLIVGEVR